MTTKRTITLTLLMLLAPQLAGAEELTLTDAMQRAVENAPARTAALAARDAGIAGRRVTSARLWPQLVAQASARYSKPTPEIDVPIFPEPLTLGTDWNASVGATAQWRVLDAPRWADVKAAGERAMAADADAANATIEVERSVRDLYLSATYLTDVVRATTTSRDVMKRSYDDLNAQLEVGLASEVEVAQARAHMAEIEARLIDAQTKRDASLAALRILLGLDPAAPLELTQTVDQIAQMDAPSAPATHPKVLSVERQAGATDFERIAATRRWLPTVDLFATAEYRYPQTLTTDEAGPAWAAGAQLSWLLFDGGLRFAAADAQAAKAAATRANAEMLSQQLEIERAQANASITSADASLRSTRARLDAARALANLTRAGVEAGTSRVIDLLDAEVQVDQARLAQVSATYQLALAKSALWRANGATFSTARGQK